MHGYPQNLETSSDYPNSPSPAVKEMLEAEGKRITTVRWLYLLAAVAILIVSYLQSEINPLGLFQDSQNMSTYLASYFPPDFSYWRTYLADTLITLSMGIWGLYWQL
jgi:phosphonate transport system permease protein